MANVLDQDLRIADTLGGFEVDESSRVEWARFIDSVSGAVPEEMRQDNSGKPTAQFKGAIMRALSALDRPLQLNWRENSVVIAPNGRGTCRFVGSYELLTGAWFGLAWGQRFQVDSFESTRWDASGRDRWRFAKQSDACPPWLRARLANEAYYEVLADANVKAVLVEMAQSGAI